VSKGAAMVYKPVGLAVSVTGGILAGMLFKQLWKTIAGEDEAPEATDASRGWGEIVLAAALQGAIFAVVKAILDRGGATGFRHLTGSWPGDKPEEA
jgi:Protein of unknown function (DUF4235)